jgi:hypothetical protein
MIAMTLLFIKSPSPEALSFQTPHVTQPALVAHSRLSQSERSIYSMYSRFMDTKLDAWEILQAEVQLGGFAPAAEKLNRSQSTISYAAGATGRAAV